MKNQIIKIFDHLKIQSPKLLGQGGQCSVYELDSKRVLKIYTNTKIDYFESLVNFQEKLKRHINKLPFDIPILQEYDSVGETFYTIEKRLNGETMDKVFPFLNNNDKYSMLQNYLGALKYLHSIKLPELPFGQILRSTDYSTSKTWSGFLKNKIKDKIGYSRKVLKQNVRNFESKVARFNQIIDTKLDTSEKILVHGDYFYGNLLVKDLKVSAIFDFGPLTVVGDYRMDVSGAVIFCETDPQFDRRFVEYLYQQAEAIYGREVIKYIEYYRIYYSFYHMASVDSGGSLHRWCIDNLNNEKIWG
jgi:aminoglycoside phosphotransferase